MTSPPSRRSIAKPPAPPTSDEGGFARLTGWASSRGRKRGLLLVLTAAGILAWLAHVVDLAALGQAFSRLRVSHLLAAGAVTACMPLVLGLRLKLVLASRGLDPGWRRCTCVVLGIHPLNVISPARLGEGFRIVALRDLADPGTLIGLVVGERLLDITMLATIAATAGLISGRNELALPALAVLGVVLCVFLVAMFSGRLPLSGRAKHVAERVAAGLLALRHSRPHLAGAIAATVVLWSLTMTLVTILFAGVGAPLSPLAIATAMPLAIFAGLLPITLGGFGTREAALVALLAGQVAAADALAAGLLYSLYTYILLGGFGLLFTRHALRY